MPVYWVILLVLVALIGGIWVGLHLAGRFLPDIVQKVNDSVPEGQPRPFNLPTAVPKAQRPDNAAARKYSTPQYRAEQEFILSKQPKGERQI